MKKTNLERHCVEFISQKKDRKIDAAALKAKIIETNLEKYGVEFPMQSEEIKNKRQSNPNPKKTKETNLELYGAEWWAQSEEARIHRLKEKARKTGGMLLGVSKFKKEEKE